MFQEVPPSSWLHLAHAEEAMHSSHVMVLSSKAQASSKSTITFPARVGVVSCARLLHISQRLSHLDTSPVMATCCHSAAKGPRDVLSSLITSMVTLPPASRPTLGAV